VHRPAVVLVEPRYPINLGLACRAMANFGFADLVLVAPKCDPTGTRARKFALRGAEVLKGVVILDRLEDLRPRFDLLVGTTRLGGRYRSHRFPPWDLPPLLAHAKRPALVFGNEARGLNERELKAMDALSSVPTVEGEPGSLNLGMAVGMFLYELSRTPRAESPAPVDRRRRLGVALADGLTRAGVLLPGDRRHGRARLYAILERLEAPEGDLKFLWSLLRQWEGKRGGPSGR
jgi:tRNA/rRNA methyltransferase